MFGFQSTNNIPYEQLGHEQGSDHINELQWVLQPYIGDKATSLVAELHVSMPHMSVDKLGLAVHALHISNIVHLRRQG